MNSYIDLMLIAGLEVEVPQSQDQGRILGQSQSQGIAHLEEQVKVIT